MKVTAACKRSVVVTDPAAAPGRESLREARPKPHAHELKTWPAYFEDILRGDKNFEVRRDDRRPPFRVGDALIMREWDERSGYSGDKLWRRITYVLPGDQFGIEAGYCVLGLGLMNDA